MTYRQYHARSLQERDAFWTEQAALIDWQKSPEQVCDYSNPPFAKWFVGGTTNLCHNAVDRHLTKHADQNALIAVSTETNTERVYSFKELHAEVQRMAAALQSLGVVQGDRVLIYMPMIAEAVFAMLACTRLGALHSVVFGGFAAGSLASRIDDAQPKVIVSADAGSRGGKVVVYKPLLDEAIVLAQHKPQSVLMVDRGLAAFDKVPGRDVDWATLRTQFADTVVPCVWVESTHPSYTLYTSGTTGKPKGVQRDTGGYAVALAASMKSIFQGQTGETYFCTSDIGWVVGHSYIVYGPLIAGMATIVYEGLPTRPDAGIWWSLVEKYQVTRMFSAPTAIRVLKKQDPELMKKYNISSLKALYLAGEPLDEPTAQWISSALNVPIIDNGEELIGPNQKGVVGIEGPLPPGCLQTIWRDDARFVNTYWKSIPNRLAYSTFDWGIRDEDGYFFILGRTDDVINVAGHRLGTREIEESISSHANVAEVAVVGIADKLKGQVAIAFVIAKDSSGLTDANAKLKLEGELMKRVDNDLGAVARPARVFIVQGLPKTRSGKLLRRALQAVAEGRDPGDLTTMDDPTPLLQIKEMLSTGQA